MQTCSDPLYCRCLRACRLCLHGIRTKLPFESKCWFYLFSLSWNRYNYPHYECVNLCWQSGELLSIFFFFFCLSFQVGDLVLIILDERHDNYVLFTVGPTLYFLHSESLTALDLKPGEVQNMTLGAGRRFTFTAQSSCAQNLTLASRQKSLSQFTCNGENRNTDGNMSSSSTHSVTMCIFPAAPNVPFCDWPFISHNNQLESGGRPTF